MRAAYIFFFPQITYIFHSFDLSPRVLVGNTVGAKKQVLREKKKIYASMQFKFVKKKSACVVSFSSEKKLGGCSFIYTDDIGKSRETINQCLLAFMSFFYRGDFVTPKPMYFLALLITI